MRSKIIMGLAMLAALPSFAGAQTARTTNRIGAWELSAGAGVMSIDRALNGNVLVPMTISDPNPGRFAVGASVRLGYNISRYFGLSLGTMFSAGSGAKAQSPFVDLTWTPSINASTQGFLLFGAGVTRFSTPGIHETSSFGAHVGAGVRQMVSERLALRLEGRMQSERFEEQRGPAGAAGVPAYNGFATLGLSYFTSGRAVRDTDGDGVTDRGDRCANTPRGAVVDTHGCPLDSDHDGVWDGLDRCPGTPANVPVDVNGCVRDSDNDGVSDNLDRCPNTIANTRVDATGCPIVSDSDNDGVGDLMDRCPGTPTSARPVDASGCPPDSDRDGVADYLDHCPNSPAGSLVDEHGCPRDGDGDRVADNIDRCPNTPAGRAVDAYGCTIIVLPANAADQMVLRVQFVTNRSELVAASTIILDSVAVAINASPGSLWEVQGFTDIRGTVRANQILSQQRAQAVVDYLVSRGVDRASLTATGFAAERAVGSNATAEGQAANRRVQLRRRPAPNPVQLR
jgi:outer membrane protein OmpA-like peptidoglycan-associated protein